MGIFYLLSVFILIGATVKPKWQTPFLFLSFASLVICAGFREETVGTDTPTYEELFLRLKRGGTIVQEIGWEFLNKIVINLGGEFQHLLVLSSLLTLVPLYYVSKKHSLNPMLSIFLYFALYIYLQSFNITRQTLAVSIILMAYPFVIDRRPLIFFLLICLASTFHVTALLCLPLIFVDKIPDKKSIYLALIGASLMISLFLSNFIIAQFARIFGYEHYLDLFEIEGGVGVYLVILNAFFVFVLFTTKKRGTLFKLFFTYIVLANLMIKVPFGYRLIYYFAIIQVLYLPYYVYNNKIRSKHIAFLIVILYAYLVFSRSAGAGGIIPYKNVLF